MDFITNEQRRKNKEYVTKAKLYLLHKVIRNNKVLCSNKKNHYSQLLNAILSDIDKLIDFHKRYGDKKK